MKPPAPIGHRIVKRSGNRIDGRSANPVAPCIARRSLLLTGAVALAGALQPLRGNAHALLGPVTPPAAPPPLRLTRSDGQTGPLHELLAGHISAVQLMFTSCSATCPIQGAIFADAQARLSPLAGELRLLSITIDPLSDDAPALKRWLQRFGAAAPRWTAAAPRVQDVDPLLDFLRGRADGVDRHTAQAFLFDRRGRLAFRTIDMPTGADLAALMQQLAARG